MKHFVIIITAMLLCVGCKLGREVDTTDCVATVTYRVYYPGDTIEKTIIIDCYSTAHCNVVCNGGRWSGSTSYLYFYLSDAPLSRIIEIDHATVPIRVVSCDIKPKAK